MDHLQTLDVRVHGGYNPIDFFTWDMNRNSIEPGSVCGKGIWLAHVAGVYEVMDRLGDPRAQLPKWAEA